MNLKDFKYIDCVNLFITVIFLFSHFRNNITILTDVPACIAGKTETVPRMLL